MLQMGEEEAAQARPAPSNGGARPPKPSPGIRNWQQIWLFSFSNLPQAQSTTGVEGDTKVSTSNHKYKPFAGQNPTHSGHRQLNRPGKSS